MRNSFFKWQSHNMSYTSALFFIILCSLMLQGCKKEKEGGQHLTDSKPLLASRNALDVPEKVRNNLGITFYEVKRRQVKRTLRVPGHFELRPEARQEYRVTVSGRVRLLVNQYEAVMAGQELFELDSPEWRRTQHELGEARATIQLRIGERKVAQGNITEGLGRIADLKNRLDKLATAGVKNAELEMEHAEASRKNEMLKILLEVSNTNVKAAEDHYRIMIQTAASISGVPTTKLLKVVDGTPHWESISELTIVADSPGVVDVLAVTNGGWSETGGLVVGVVDSSMIRFRAQALQSDLTKFKNVTEVSIVPPNRPGVDFNEAIKGKLVVGLSGDAQQRTFPLYAIIPILKASVTAAEKAAGEKVKLDWAVPGITAFMEIVVDGIDLPRLAIPRKCIVRSGLDDVFFKRDRNDPDRVLRVKADIGVDDGRWVEILSDIGKGDSIVVDGAYELKLATDAAPKAKKDGHFHADGTFHNGKH